jgi:(2Fe-2S) ferredoxin
VERAGSPYIAHIFVCGNDRGGTRKSCADGGGSAGLREQLKQAVADRGWRPRVRVSHAGCLGLCAQGPNVMIYPQGIWFAGVQPGDAQAILAEVERLLAG